MLAERENHETAQRDVTHHDGRLAGRETHEAHQRLSGTGREGIRVLPVGAILQEAPGSGLKA